MPDIRPDKRIVTQITTVKMRPDNQDDVLALMKERAKFMAGQPASCRSACTAARTARMW